MNQQQEPKRDEVMDAAAICFIWALALQMPIRRHVGKNMLGFSAAGALVFAFFYGGLFYSVPAMLWACLYFVSLIFHRIATFIRRRRGMEPHTYYNGYPWLGEIFRRRFDQVVVKSTLEPLLMILLGVCCAPFGQASVVFFIGGAVCMLVTTRLSEMQHQKRIDDMRDAMIEGQLLKPGFRKRRW